MIKRLTIQNYKSIEKLDVDLERFNVFIGENGCGKTNILEAIAFGITADEPEKLPMKGIRMTEPRYLTNGFSKESGNKIFIDYYDNKNNAFKFELANSEDQYLNWEADRTLNGVQLEDNLSQWSENLRKKTGKMLEYVQQISTFVDEISANKNDDKIVQTKLKDVRGILKEAEVLNEDVQPAIALRNVIKEIVDFSVYSPENTVLRSYNIDTSYIQPLGAKGEGLLKLIKLIKQDNPEQYKEIVEYLHLIDWFSDIEIEDDKLSGANFKIKDKFLEEGIEGFDIRNANEGFFLLLFYLALFVNDHTPSFFAIDNIDTALNPKLCTKLIEILAELAKKHNKQVLITTHNPSILDGINLNDPEQRLFAVSRNKLGYTRVTRVEKKPPVDGQTPVKLSEQFLRGYIGGIPKNF